MATEVVVERRPVPQAGQRVLPRAFAQGLQRQRRVQRTGRVGGHDLEVLQLGPIERAPFRARRQEEAVPPTVALQARGRQSLDACPPQCLVTREPAALDRANRVGRGCG